MNILVACEESQAVTKELRSLGHNAFSCDIQECSGGKPEWHIKGDVLPLLNGFCDFTTQNGDVHIQHVKWDMIIAHPPCTFLTVTGNRWFNVEKYGDKALQRMKDREEAIEFFMAFANADCEKIAIENPIGVMSTIWRKPDCIIQPYEFGDPFEKKTCLWLKGLKKLVPTNIVDPPKRKEFASGKTMPAWYADAFSLPKEERARLRSKTFPGIAKAIAEQWAGDANKKEKEKEEMELKMTEYQLPENISFNFEELKAELTAKVGIYETMIYSDDQIKVAKKDKADLNRLKKALNDERIRREKEYMIPFNAFKAQVAEIIAIIDKPVAVIDRQVKAYEDKQKQDKLDEITAFFNETEHPEWLHFSQLFDERWLNASASMKSVQDAITTRIGQIAVDLETLSNLPEFSFESTAVYKTSLDMNKALNEGHRMSEIAKQKAEQERLKAEAEMAKHMNPPVEEVAAPDVEVAAIKDPKMWVRFQALMTVGQAKELKQFFVDRNIEFKAV